MFLYIFIIRKILSFSNVYSDKVIPWLLLGSPHIAVQPVHCTILEDATHIDYSLKDAPWSCVTEQPSYLPFSVQPCPVISTNIYLASTMPNIVLGTTEISTKSRQKILPLQCLHSSGGER